MWPFRRKGAAIPETKATSFLLSLGAGRAGLSGAAFDKLAQEGYVQNSIANVCVNKIASAASSVEWKLYRRQNGKLKEIDQHELLDLLESPNPAQSAKDFRRDLAANYLIGGDSFVLGNGLNDKSKKKPTELQLLHPSKVKVEPGETIFPKEYEYRPNNKSVSSYPVNQLTGQSAVLHLKTYNPLDQWRGLSPMLGAALGIDIFNSGQNWNKKLLDNDARPAGALQMKTSDGKAATLTDEQRQRLKEDIESLFTGSQNAGRPLVLEGGMEWQQLSMTSKDMDFLNGKYSSARDIGLVYGVPSQLLGIPGDSTFANYEQAMLSFWGDTVLPFVGLILEAFNRWLVPLYGKDLFLWYDENAIPALEPRRKALFDRLNDATFLTDDEKRFAAGFDTYKPSKSPAGVLFKPTGVIPIEMAGTIELPEPGSPADQEEERDE